MLYAEPLPADLTAIVRATAPDGFVVQVMRSQDRQELLARIRDADFVLVASTRIDAEVVRAAPGLRHIQHQGVGYNNIDVGACAQAGVSVALTPEGTTTGVAEHTFLLVLALYKQLRLTETALRSGGWPVWEFRTRSFELAGKTMGLVGFGRIGRAVAARARAFEANIVYYDPCPVSAEQERALGVSGVGLDEVLSRSDIVSLHLPLTPETHGCLGARELGLMQAQAILINTARGPLVDETALVEALISGRIAGAGLDVFVAEPPAPDNPLLRLDNVVVTPHIAAGTKDAFVTKMRAAFGNLERVARGVQPLHEVSSIR